MLSYYPQQFSNVPVCCSDTVFGNAASNTLQYKLTNYLQKRYGPSLVNIKFLEREFFFPDATTPIGGCILQPSSGL